MSNTTNELTELSKPFKLYDNYSFGDRHHQENLQDLRAWL